MTQISLFRMSFMWVETVPAILSGSLAADAPCAFLGRYGDYASAFDGCQAGKPAPGGLTLPWDRPHGNFYWKYYFEGKHAGDVTGVQAWKKIVAFAKGVGCKLVTQDACVKPLFTAFFAPQGIGLVAQLSYRGDAKAVADIATLARTIRHEYRFAVDGSDGPAAGVKLDEAAERALAVARKAAFGDTEGFAGDNQPFSVTTFLSGEDVAAIKQGGDEHFLLETVAGWNEYLKPQDLEKLPLADAQLAIRDADAENMMYARRVARAIWFPRRFAAGAATSTLSCYHQNIVQASLQTLSLGEFVSWVAAEYDAGRAVEPAVVERAVRAAQLLQMLVAGQSATGRKITYRTSSIVEQIKNAGWTRRSPSSRRCSQRDEQQANRVPGQAERWAMTRASAHALDRAILPAAPLPPARPCLPAIPGRRRRRSRHR